MKRALLLGILLGVGGCKDLGLPAGTPDPSIYNTAAGAVGMRNAAVYQFESALYNYVVDAGLLTDELENNKTGAGAAVHFPSTDVVDPLDERILPEGIANGYIPSYRQLQLARGFIDQALGALTAYDTTADTATGQVLRGELDALEGYTELMLADLFCSGVPLSTLDFQQDYTYAPSSTTVQVYQAALAKFDTALTLAGASDSVRYLAQVGKGRAYLALGQYAAAADDVSTIPDGFQYRLAVNWSPSFSTYKNSLSNKATMSDREGMTGLPYRFSHDPRTAGVFIAIYSDLNFTSGDSLFFPAKYSAGLSGSFYAPYTLASGTEARLIQAEAALQVGDTAQWLTMLNALRVTGSADSVTLIDTLGVTPSGYGPPGRLLDQHVDTVYNAGHTKITHIYTINTYLRPIWSPGTGGVSGLYPIADPGDPVARIDTLFTERAAWLFLTGERQGDLRRLLRQYNQYPAFQSQELVYPTGIYLAPGPGTYGADVTATIPVGEYANPNFHGCLDRQP